MMASLENNMFNEPTTPPKLSLLTLSRATIPPELPTPPPSAVASVPFQWEEAPGKPRLCHTRSVLKGSGGDVARTLELPPRLMLLESPTTVLDGPYVGRAVSFTSPYRSSSKDAWRNDNFVSNRWRKNSDPGEGSFVFSSFSVDGTRKVKITRVKRKGSFSSFPHRGSHLWASIYESFKQVVSWKRKQEKQKKIGTEN